MRPVYMVGDRPLSDDAMARLLMADRVRGAPIIIFDGRYYEVPAATATVETLKPAPKAEPIVDPAYVDRAKAAALAKRARKAALRLGSA